MEKIPLRTKKIREYLTVVDNTCLEALTRKVKKTSKTGVKGVERTLNGNFAVRICIKGEKIHIGTFESIEEASLQRERAERKYFAPILRQYGKELNQE